MFNGFCRTDGAHVDVGGSLGQRVGDALVENNLADCGAVFEHGDEDIGRPDSIAGIIKWDRTVWLQGRGFIRGTVPNLQSVSCAEEVPGHGGTHEAGSEEGDGGEVV